ncbi:MAG TPA: hypothetical protein VHB79_13025 [Polyangiaceae bacterium]|nr:hypothetical protein [Polyangiaceae bacterium]
MSVYALHGVALASSLTLPALRARPGAEPELRVQEPAASELAFAGAGEVFAELDVPGARYVARRGPFGVGCDYAEWGRVLFGADGSVTLGTLGVPQAQSETARALLSGSALALWLVAHAQLVLHASTVAWDDCSVALVGGSGAGKTTLAAQCVIAGAYLVGDDVLRVAFDGETARWHAGARWLRLREGSSSLLDAWPGRARHAEEDGRWVLEPGEATLLESGPLDALLWPRLDAAARDFDVQRLPAAEGLRRLLLGPRVRGLVAPDLLRAQFEKAAQLVRALPCFEATIPTGPPFADARKLRSELARQVSGR